MPVHLFGRPAPLAELTGFGAADRRGRRAGVRLARHRAAPGSPRPSASIRRRTSSASATAGSSPPATPSSPSASGCCASTARRRRRRSSTSATTRASTRSRPRRCGSSCASSTAGRPRAARRPRATPSSGSASSCEIPEDEPGHVYHLFVCRSPERDRIRAALTEAEIGNAQYYLPPLHLQPALRYLGYDDGRAAGDRARRRARTSPCRSGPGITRRAAGAGRRRRSVPSSASPRGREDVPINRHRLPQVAADAAIVVAAWFLAFRLRFDTEPPALLRVLRLLGAARARRGDQARRSSRSSASTTAGGATSRRATCGAPPAASSPRRSSRSSSSASSSVHAADSAADGLGDRRPADPRARRRLAHARAHDHRAPAGPLDRRARQGGDRRRRR